jgi:hypothetical protein
MTKSGHQILTLRDIIFCETHINFTQNFIQQDEVEEDSLFDANFFQFRMIEIPNPQTQSLSVPQNSSKCTTKSTIRTIPNIFVKLANILFSKYG